MADTLIIAGEVRPELIVVVLVVLAGVLAAIAAAGALYFLAGVRVGRGAPDARLVTVLAAVAWLGFAAVLAVTLTLLLPLLLLHPVLFGAGWAWGRFRRPAVPPPPPAEP